MHLVLLVYDVIGTTLIGITLGDVSGTTLGDEIVLRILTEISFFIGDRCECLLWKPDAALTNNYSAAPNQLENLNK